MWYTLDAHGSWDSALLRPLPVGATGSPHFLCPPSTLYPGIAVKALAVMELPGNRARHSRNCRRRRSKAVKLPASSPRTTVSSGWRDHTSLLLRVSPKTPERLHSGQGYKAGPGTEYKPQTKSCTFPGRQIPLSLKSLFPNLCY